MKENFVLQCERQASLFFLTFKASSVLEVASFKEYKPFTEMNSQLKSQSFKFSNFMLENRNVR